MRFRSLALLCLVAAGCRPLSAPAQVGPYDSGGPLMPEQAAYDVSFYDLALAVHPVEHTIDGTLAATATIVSPTEYFVLDLDPVLDVSAVYAVAPDGTTRPLAFERKGGKLWAAFRYMKQPGDRVTVAVDYGGTPRVAPNAPWDGGFTWATTPSGQPWIATTCQSDGADIWWPVKDHVSDEPDSMAININVPDPLVVASNGALRSVEVVDDGTHTYHWFVSTPINTYDVALNIAPYRTIEGTLQSVAGDTFPVVFYVLPEDYDRGKQFFPEILDHLRFYERTLGPYPFRADKYGVAQTPHLGMEHQSIIAYGAHFDNGAMTGGVDWGFDALHHHELSHEWWGNMVTNADWSDMWLHEGFGTYMQALYMEELEGDEGYHRYMNSMRRGISNRQPVAPRGVRSADQIYGGDIYSKGAWILHSLRYLIGEDTMRTALRRMAYPDPAMEQVTDGSQCRFATTDDFLHLVEDLTGRDLDWFFDVYLRQPRLPSLGVRRDGTTLELAWSVPDDMPFPMPVDVQVDGEVRRVEMADGKARINVPEGVNVVVDPDGWVLKDEGR